MSTMSLLEKQRELGLISDADALLEGLLPESQRGKEKEYYADWRLISPEMEAWLRQQKGTFHFGPKDPMLYWEDFLPPEMIGNMSGFPIVSRGMRRNFGQQTEEDYLEDQQAKADAYRARYAELIKLSNDPDEYKRLKKFYEKQNGIKLLSLKAWRKQMFGRSACAVPR